MKSSSITALALNTLILKYEMSMQTRPRKVPYRGSIYAKAIILIW